jgi:hypothetical protein
MTRLAMEIRHHDGEFFPRSSLDRTRDALAANVEYMACYGRRKWVYVGLREDKPAEQA